MNIQSEQKIYSMTLEEFMKLEVPKGWKLHHVSGHERHGWSGALDNYFEMIVTVEKENENAIL